MAKFQFRVIKRLLEIRGFGYSTVQIYLMPLDHTLKNLGHMYFGPLKILGFTRQGGAYL